MGRKIVKYKTIFKTKIEADKTCGFKTRMIMKGFMLQPGIDFIKKHFHRSHQKPQPE